jgi:hypothetical protein
MFINGVESFTSRCTLLRVYSATYSWWRMVSYGWSQPHNLTRPINNLDLASSRRRRKSHERAISRREFTKRARIGRVPARPVKDLIVLPGLSPPFPTTMKGRSRDAVTLFHRKGKESVAVVRSDIFFSFVTCCMAKRDSSAPASWRIVFHVARKGLIKVNPPRPSVAAVTRIRDEIQQCSLLPGTVLLLMITTYSLALVRKRTYRPSDRRLLAKLVPTYVD